MSSAHATTRLVALRLIRVDTLMVKETTLPVAFRLRMAEPLSDAQLKRLGLASPWAPVMIEAHMGEWSDRTGSFDAIVVIVEAPPRIDPPPHRRTLRWGLTRMKRGFVSHD